MKIYKIATVLGIIILSLSTSAFAAYYFVGIGSGGEAGEKNLTLEVGSRNIKIRNKPFLAGIGIPVMDHGDDHIPSGTKGSPCLHEYTSLGQKPEGIEIGLLGKFGMKLFRPNLYMSVLGGITRVHEIHLTRSTTNPDIYYEQSSENKLYGVYGISVGYFPEIFGILHFPFYTFYRI